LFDGATYNSKGSMTLGSAGGSSGSINLYSSAVGNSTCQINGDLIVGGAGHGALNVTGGSTLTITGTINAAQQSGSSAGMTVDGAGSLLHAVAIHVGGSLQAAGGNGSLTVSNQGKVTVNNTLNIWSSSMVDVSNSGIVNIGAGASPAAGTVRVGAGGILSGSGTVVGNVLTDGGTVRPGSSPGSLHITGNYQQLAGSTLKIEIGGTTAATGYDQLLVTGNMALGGTLQVLLINSFAPQVGQSFNIVDWGMLSGTLSGTFSTLQLPALGGSTGWNTSQLYTAGVLSVANVGFLHGDWNRDGQVTAADIPAMLTALTDLNAYASNNSLSPTQLAAIGDFDSSGTVTNRDIQGLLDLIASQGGGSVTAVPEPASLALLALALPMIVLKVRRRLLANVTAHGCY
jgi:hypothetical protein